MFDHQTLDQVVIDVCNTMLGLNVISTESADIQQETHSQQETTVAKIHISGAIEALVEVEATAGMSHQIATAMFDTETLTDDDINDALGETVNMIGGNIKGMVPGESLLSLPRVGVQSTDVESVDALNTVMLSFSSQAELMSVRLIELKPADVTIS